MSSFIHIKFNTNPLLVKLVRALNFVKYKIVRPVISLALYQTKYKKAFSKIHRTFDNQELKKGISVYIPCKDEETHLMMCLESLIGIADQFILLDNGSTDNTLRIMEEFREKHSHEAQIEVYAVPEMLLVEMVQFALTKVQFSWVLKWDGDMLALNEGHQFDRLKKKCLNLKRPAAYTLKRINLTGDYLHVSSWGNVVDEGEPFLRTFNNQFIFKEEFGRLEHAVIPIYYKLDLRKEFFSFHFSNLRPPIRIMLRHCYLDWRQTINLGNSNVKLKYADYRTYQTDWFLHNFGTSETKAIKFRAGRLIASMSRKFDIETYTPLPRVIKDQIEKNEARFVVQYQDDKPYLMIDQEDPEMTEYTASQEDLNWKPDHKLFFNDTIRLNFYE